LKKDTGKWCKFHKIPWHNTDKCFSKQSLLAKTKSSRSNDDSDSDSELEKGKQIIDAKPSVTISTTKVHPKEPKELEEGEHLFHSHIWVKGNPIHFIVDNDNHKKLMLIEVIQKLNLTMTQHPQAYTILWLSKGRDIHVIQQCDLHYNIKPFKDELLCDASPLKFVVIF
jgi:hypothetical protein